MQQMVLGAQKKWPVHAPLRDTGLIFIQVLCMHRHSLWEAFHWCNCQKPQQTLGWLKFPSASCPQGQTKCWMKVIQLQAYLPVGQISKGWKASIGNTWTKLSTRYLEGDHDCTVFEWLPTSTNFSSCAGPSALLLATLPWWCLNRKAFEFFRRLLCPTTSYWLLTKQINQNYNIPSLSHSSQHFLSVILAPRAQKSSQTKSVEWLIPTSFQVSYVPFSWKSKKNCQ